MYTICVNGRLYFTGFLLLWLLLLSFSTQFKWKTLRITDTRAHYSSNNGASFRLSGKQSVFKHILLTRYPDLITNVRVNFGKVRPMRDGCSVDSTIWFLVGGHLRGFETQLANFESFVRPAGCYVIAFYVRDKMDHESPAWWRNESANLPKHPAVSRDLCRISNTLRDSTCAFAIVTQQKDAVDQADVFGGLWLLQRLMSEIHDIPSRAEDIFIRTRPDLLYSHTLSYPRLRALAHNYAHHRGGVNSTFDHNNVSTTGRSPVGFGFLMRHEAKAYNIYDPSELFWVGNKMFFDSLFPPCDDLPDQDPVLYETRDAFRFCGPVHGCCLHNLSKNSSASIPNNCGTNAYTHLLLFRPNRAGCDVFFIREEFKIHIRRLTGGYAASINRPSKVSAVNPNPIKLDVLDISKDSVRVIGGLDTQCVDSNLEQVLTRNGYKMHCYGPGTKNGICSSSNTLQHQFLLKEIRDVHNFQR